MIIVLQALKKFLFRFQVFLNQRKLRKKILTCLVKKLNPYILEKILSILHFKINKIIRRINLRSIKTINYS
jgi:hypothetical protein